jgi:hypothetical protein
MVISKSKGLDCMARFEIRHLEGSEVRCCPECGQNSAGRRGLSLFSEDHGQPVCRTCGKKLAPAMIALLDLAQTAERVGRRARNLLSPPMESLLDLASAAENYSLTAPGK